MNLLIELRNRIRALLFGARADRESVEEFAFHLDMETEKLIRKGMSPEAARRKAAVAFGGLPGVRERTRDARGARLAEDALRDLAYGVRQVVRWPTFSIVTVLTIALGIGGVTAIWSVVDGVLLRPVPVESLDRLVMVWQTDRSSGTTREPSSWPDFVDLKRESRSFAETAALTGQVRSYRSEGGDTSRLVAIATTESYFDLLGVETLVGRTFTTDETRPGGASVAVLGEELWRTRFATDLDILGTTIVLDEIPHEVIGVVPRAADFGLDQIHSRAAYHGPYTGGQPIDVWLPIQTSAPRATHPFLVIGRLAKDVQPAAAQAEATALATRLEQAYPQSNTNRGMFVEALDTVVFARVRPMMWLLVGAVTLLLAVSFVNVTNLLLARSGARGREIALRTALGAGTARIARQLLVENALLTAIGAVFGVALAHGILQLLLSLAPKDIPRVADVGIDARVLLATLAVSVLGALLFALVPTLEARRVDMVGTIQGKGRSASGDRRSRLLRQVLVVAELALSVALVISAGLLARSLWSALAVDPGFHAAGVVKAQFQLPQSRYPRDFSRWPALDEIHGFNDRLLARVSALPGVQSVALAGSHPLDSGFTNSFQIVGREGEGADWPEISMRLVSPGYFETLRTKVLDGRPLEERDRTDSEAVAVINRTAADRLFDRQPALGQAISFWGTERRIVGVIENERIHGLTEAVPMALYAPLAQVPSNSGVLLVRAASGDPMVLAEEVAAAIRTTDPGLAVYGVERLSDTLQGTLGERRFAMLVLATMAGVTLLLALIGVHGVLGYAAAQRTREIGIRTALGARRIEVAGLVVKSGLTMAMSGVALGLALAMAGSRLLESLLYGVTELDPLTDASVPLAMLAAAALASWLPARRAARVEVLEALRAE